MRLTLRSTLALLAVGAVAGVSFWAGQQQANAAAAAHVYELRTYTTPEGKLGDLNSRFRDHTVKIFEKHGMKNIIYMTPMEGPTANNTLVYLLQHDSRDAAKASWASFQKDPDWVKARTASEVNGKLTTKVESVFYTPTDYSPIK